MPTVSVIMPTYNQKESYLRGSIESILHQTFKDLEFIIIDDGSTDTNTKRILDEYSKLDSRIKMIKNGSNQGIISSLNLALKSASGVFIARMDSDDISLPDRFEKQLHFLNQHPTYALVGTWATIINDRGEKIGALEFPNSYKLIRSTLLIRNAILHPTWMFRRALVQEVGPYDIRSVGVEDYEFLLRIARDHPIANLREQLIRYRFNTSGLSFKKNKVQERSALALRFRAIRHYGYPIWQSLYLIRPILLFLFIPSFLKKALLRLSFKLL